MNLVIGAGGTGARVFEALINLCAAGLGPLDPIKLFLIDPDASNGNVSRLRQQLAAYNKCREYIHGEVKVMGYPFGTEFAPYIRPGDSELSAWSPIPSDATLGEGVLKYSLLSKTEKMIVDLLFTKQEKETALTEGFRGHPSIGAMTMTLLSQHQTEHQWAQILQDIQSAITSGHEAKVILVGSVFGGTGASALHPIAKFLFESVVGNKNLLKIGVVAVVPYFGFNKEVDAPAEGVALETAPTATNTEMAARSEWFSLATKSALQFYRHLYSSRKDGSLNADWPFEWMFWLGDHDLASVDYNVGGPEQRNPAHVVELIAGLHLLDAFTKVPGRGLYYASPACNVELQFEESSITRWDDLPFSALQPSDIRRTLWRNLMIAAAHVGFLSELLKMERLDYEPSAAPWFYERFYKQGDWKAVGVRKPQMDALDLFYKKYYLAWWKQLISSPAVMLFNPVFLQLDSDGAGVDLQRFGVMLHGWRGGARGSDSFASFFERMILAKEIEPSHKGVTAYIDLLWKASDAFVIHSLTHGH